MDGGNVTTATRSPSCALTRHARLRLSRHKCSRVTTLVVVCALLLTSSSHSFAVNAESTRRTGLTASKPGTASDFVSLYYALYNASLLSTATLSPVVFKQSVPVEIKERLDVYSLTFSDLPELLKRALLWENGYSLGDADSVAQIHTLCGLSMAEIALSEDEYTASTCEVKSCSSTSWSHSPACKADQLLTVTKCASTAVDAVSSTSMWTSKTLSAQQNSTSGSTAVPSIQIRRHNWTDPEATQPAHVYAIHTTPQEETDVCAASTASSVVIPCVPYQRTDKRWCRPTQSDVMTNWLEDYAQKAQLDHTLEVGSMKTPGPVEPAHATKSSQDLNDTAEFAKDAHGVYVSAAYKFDGTSSDFTQQFYQRYLALGNNGQASISKLVLPEPLPREVQDRLADASLQFDDLPALLQRALVWDSGYTLSANSSTLTAVYVKCGLSMGDIAVSEAAMNQVSRSGNNGSCTAQSCSFKSNSSETYRAFTCTDDQMRTMTLCAVAPDSSASNDSSSSSSSSSRLTPLWANGGDDSATPELSVSRHAWANDGKTYVMYSINAAAAAAGTGETSSSRCPDTPSMVIPCVQYSPSPAASSSTNTGSAFAKGADWCRPRPGPLVTSWLRQVAKEKQFSLLYLIPVLISVALGVTGLAIYIRRKTFKRFELKTDGSGGAVCRANTMASTPDGTFMYGHLSLSQGNSCVMVDARLSALSTSSSIESFAAFSSNHVLNTLVNHPSLRLNTIPFDQIQFMNLLSEKGARTEVWLGSVRGVHVAVKRLSKAKKAEYDELEEYMGEITLHASLDHPNIAKFIGVAWTTLQNLCVVTEYVDNGDLQLYLKQHCLQLAWEKAKMRIAMGIASAVCCLHQQQPCVLFGDLKSKSVLLTMELDAKLINAGVNRTCVGQLNEEQTVDTTHYWTAPEVLQGHMQSEKADMYAFGVILAELDTHQPPYEGLKCMATGADLPPLQILQKVVAEELKPTTSPFCPLGIAELIDACLDKDPQRRPSASEAMVVLAKVPIASVGVKTYSF